MGNHESRFTLAPHTTPDTYVTTDWEAYGEQLKLRHTCNRGRQWLRIQPTDEGTYLRFDRHPQPGIAIDGNTIVSHNASLDPKAEWYLALIKEFDSLSGTWEPYSGQSEHLADSCAMQNRKFLIALRAKSTDEFLAVNKDGVPVLKRFGELIDTSLSKEELGEKLVFEDGVMWELSYAGAAPSAGDAAVISGAVALPLVLIPGVGQAVIAAIGPAAFAQFGFTAVLALQTVGMATASAAAVGEMACIAELCKGTAGEKIANKLG